MCIVKKKSSHAYSNFTAKVDIICKKSNHKPFAFILHAVRVSHNLTNMGAATIYAKTYLRTNFEQENMLLFYPSSEGFLMIRIQNLCV